MKPSRTYRLALIGLIVLALLGLGLFVVALMAPDTLGELAGPISTIALAVAGASGAGAGAMAARDYGSGGLTSSQGETVAETFERNEGEH
jgi:hypothetical protein